MHMHIYIYTHTVPMPIYSVRFSCGVCFCGLFCVHPMALGPRFEKIDVEETGVITYKPRGSRGRIYDDL